MLRHKFFGQIKHEISRELYVYTFRIRDPARSRGGLRNADYLSKQSPLEFKMCTLRHLLENFYITKILQTIYY